MNSPYAVTLKDIDQLVEEGKYDWVHEVINSQNCNVMSHNECSVVEVELVPLMDLDGAATPEEARLVLRQRGLPYAPVQPLLAFGAAYPECQLESPIVGLGSHFYSKGCVPMLWSIGQERYAGLAYPNRVISPKSRFLIARFKHC